MIIELKNLSKSYGNKQALKNISLELTPGIYGLLGPNGAGKSTMMNIITGNLKQTDGDILFNGKDIGSSGKSFRRRIGYCPQQQTLYPGFTAEQFLFYMASLHGMNKKKARERIDWALKIFSLYDIKDKRIKSLSGGMKQRLLLAQSVLHDPDILILDEPTAGLDPRQRIAVRNIIGEIALHKIVLISTHVVQDVEFIAKEIIFLSGGDIICKGTANELTNSIGNKVWEIVAAEEALPEIMKIGTVCGIAKEGDNVAVRILSEKQPDGFCTPVRPNLEDVYLYYFGTAVEL